MQVKRLTLKDKLIFEKYLSLEKHSLSAYAFSNIFIWGCMYDIFWAVIKSNLCVFFKDRVGCFLYLPPLGSRFEAGALNSSFEIMDKFNNNPIISRIENVEEDAAVRYKDLGYKAVLAGCDYLCRRQSLASLKGSPFKKKRASVNHFVSSYDFQYRPYRDKDKKECLDLYSSWMKERKEKNSDTIYQRLLQDNFRVFEAALNSYPKLGFTGRVIKIDGKIKAVTLGYALNNETFVVLFEVCDLNFKGISQYIFREFSAGLSHKDINIMDDSGLENLKKVKLSYRPYKSVNNFVISRG